MWNLGFYPKPSSVLIHLEGHQKQVVVPLAAKMPSLMRCYNIDDENAQLNLILYLQGLLVCTSCIFYFLSIDALLCPSCVFYQQQQGHTCAGYPLSLPLLLLSLPIHTFPHSPSFPPLL